MMVGLSDDNLFFCFFRRNAMSSLVHFFKILAVIILLGIVLLFLQVNGQVMTLVEGMLPGHGWLAWLLLAGLELLALGALGWSFFVRPAPLRLRLEATEAERRAFVAELTRRLRHNAHVRAAGLDPHAPDFPARALEVLDAEADRAISADAKRIFLGTALIQNGRLDALIVFLSLCRMVWKVSAIYNQRPSLREVWSVYTAVSSATFVAFSLESLDIPRTVSEAMSSLVPVVTPALTAASLPVVGASVQVFTNATIDGAANALLAIRVGMSTKHVFRLSMEAQENRRISLKACTSMLLSVSQECVTEVVRALKEQFRAMGFSAAETVKDAAYSCGSAVGSSIRTAVHSMGDGVSAAGAAVCRGGTAVVSAVDSGASATVQAVGRAADAVGSGVRSAVTSVGDGVSAAGAAVCRGGTAVVSAVDSGASATVQAVGRAADAVGSGVRSAVTSMGDGVSAAGSGMTSVLRRCLRWKTSETDEDAKQDGRTSQTDGK